MVSSQVQVQFKKFKITFTVSPFCKYDHPINHLFHFIVYLCNKLFILSSISFIFIFKFNPLYPSINLVAQFKLVLPGALSNYSANNFIRLGNKRENIFRMAEGGSGVTWSLNFVEPVIAFLTGLFFGYQIWAKNQPVDSDFEDEEVKIILTS